MLRSHALRLLRKFCVLVLLVAGLAFSLSPASAKYCPAEVPCPELWQCNPDNFGCHCVSEECCRLYYPQGDGVDGPCPDPW